MYFGNHVARQNIPLVLQYNQENEWEGLENDEKWHGDALWECMDFVLGMLEHLDVEGGKLNVDYP